LTMPMTIMAGRGDNIVAVSHNRRRLHATISESTLQLMDTGHMVHHVFPEEVAAAVDKLQAELSEAKQAAQ